MKKFHLFAIAAAIYFVPNAAFADCVSVIEPTVVAESPKIERVFASLPKQALKQAKDNCREYNREHHAKSKKLITRFDEAIDLQESPNGLYFRGTAEFRACCLIPNPAQ